MFKDCGAIVARLPSHIPKKLYVFIEDPSSADTSFVSRTRITTKSASLKGMVRNQTISMTNLPAAAKWGIFTGRIHWLFIPMNWQNGSLNEKVKNGLNGNVVEEA